MGHGALYDHPNSVTPHHWELWLSSNYDVSMATVRCSNSILIYLFRPQPMNSLFLHLLVTSDVINASSVIGEIFR